MSDYSERTRQKQRFDLLCEEHDFMVVRQYAQDDPSAIIIIADNLFPREGQIGAFIAALDPHARVRVEGIQTEDYLRRYGIPDSCTQDTWETPETVTRTLQLIRQQAEAATQVDEQERLVRFYIWRAAAVRLSRQDRHELKGSTAASEALLKRAYQERDHIHEQSRQLAMIRAGHFVGTAVTERKREDMAGRVIMIGPATWFATDELTRELRRNGVPHIVIAQSTEVQAPDYGIFREDDDGEDGGEEVLA